MATLYKNRNVWYITVSTGNKRLTRSLRTKDKQVAKQLKPTAELELLSQLSGATQQIKNLPFDELVRCYLKADHNWSKRTRELNDYVFRSYQSGKPLPTNPTSRSIFVRTINACWNWGIKHSLITKSYKLEGDTKGESRNRVLSDSELKTLLASFNSSTSEARCLSAAMRGRGGGARGCISRWAFMRFARARSPVRIEKSTSASSMIISLKSPMANGGSGPYSESSGGFASVLRISVSASTFLIFK